MAAVHNLETARTIRDVKRGWRTIDGIPFQCEAWSQENGVWMIRYEAGVSEAHFRKGLRVPNPAKPMGFLKWLCWFVAGCFVVRILFGILGL
jgi:hypothetical protein